MIVEIDGKKVIKHNVYVLDGEVVYASPLREFKEAGQNTTTIDSLGIDYELGWEGTDRVRVQNGLQVGIFSLSDYYVWTSKGVFFMDRKSFEDTYFTYTKVTDGILKELGFTLEGNRWVHEKGCFIYINKLPHKLKELVEILTGTAYKKALLNCK